MANSESDFGVAFALLSGVEVVVGKLFLVHSGLEVFKHLRNSVQGVSGFQLGFHLNHDFHDVSAGLEIQFVLLEEIDVECGCAKQADK